MLEFLKEKTDGKTDVFALYDGSIAAARAYIRGAALEKVEFADKAADEKYGDFLLRSAAFVLKNRGRDITAGFTDDRLIAIGFTAAENGGMKADSWKLNLDKCGGCK